MTRIVRGLVALSMVAVTLAAASPSSAQSVPPRMAFLTGDSVMAALMPTYTDAAQRVIGGGGWATTIDAKVCRKAVTPGCLNGTPESVLAVLQANRPRLAGAVVIQIGHNDDRIVTYRAQLDKILDELTGVPRVFLMTMREVSSSYVTANRTIREAAAARSNVQVIDWAAASRSQTSWVAGDGLHLTTAGATAMANLILRELDAWHAAVVARSSCTPRPSTNPPGAPSPASGRGYWMLDSTGRVWPFGAAVSHGDLVSKGVATPPASFQSTPTGGGYWIVDQAGVVHAFGDARTYGDMSAVRLNGPVRRIETSPSGSGYWLVASDGGVFSFGDARFWGSMGGIRLNAPVISMASTATGAGYWLVAGDGGVFSFGDAVFRGSTGSMRLNAPVISMAVVPDGRGYWLYAQDGGVFSFGVPFHGSVPGTGLCGVTPTVAMRVTATGDGYWVVTRTGQVFAFGDAADHGGSPALTDGASIIDLAVMR